MFYELRGLLEDIWNGDSDVTWEDFNERLEDAWENGELSGTEYDWLINNMGDIEE